MTRCERCIVSYLKSVLKENPVSVTTSSPSGSLGEDSDAAELHFPSPVPVTRSGRCVVSYLKSALIENPVGVSTSSPSKSLAEDSDATEFFFHLSSTESRSGDSVRETY